MSTAKSIAEHWGTRDFYALITSELSKLGKPLEGLTVEDLSPVDHFHARGFPATQELADRLPIQPGQHILDIGCGLGGPARYIAKRFQCKVSGIDITPAFVEAGNKLTALVRMEAQVKIELGDGQSLPYEASSFNGAYSQHVTMNVPDRPKFFAEAWRVDRTRPRPLRPAALPRPLVGGRQRRLPRHRRRNPRLSRTGRLRRHRHRGHRSQVPGRVQDDD
jgi:SAM-dependent methyltransferase